MFGPTREYKQCPTHLIQQMFNYDQVGIPKLREAMTILVDDKGICQTRKALEECRKEERDV